MPLYVLLRLTLCQHPKLPHQLSSSIIRMCLSSYSKFNTNSSSRHLWRYCVTNNSEPRIPRFRLGSIRGPMPCLRLYTKDASKNYYKILGVQRNATLDEIKTAYYEQSKIHHPDTKKGEDDDLMLFREITEAYEVLGNQQLRDKYDKGILGTVGDSATQPFRTKPVEHEEFYHGRLSKKSHMVADKKHRSYNVDEWTQSRITNRFQHHQGERDRLVKKQQRMHIKSHEGGSGMDYVLGSIIIFAGLMYFIFKPKDDDKPKK